MALFKHKEHGYMRANKLTEAEEKNGWEEITEDDLLKEIGSKNKQGDSNQSRTHSR